MFLGQTFISSFYCTVLVFPVGIFPALTEGVSLLLCPRAFNSPWLAHRVQLLPNALASFSLAPFSAQGFFSGNCSGEFREQFSTNPRCCGWCSGKIRSIISRSNKSLHGIKSQQRRSKKASKLFQVLWIMMRRNRILQIHYRKTNKVAN